MISNIQALRAFAAINVVLFHIIGVSKSYSQDIGFLRYLEGWGANGVDIFFVISGFIMLHIHMTRKRSPFDFLKNRFLRIVPIYWLLTFCIITLYLCCPSIFREMTITPKWAISSLFFTSSVFMNQHPVVQIGWTLEWEMFFYLVFSIGLLFNSLRVQIAFVTLSLACFTYLAESYIGLEFAFGMFIAYSTKKWVISKKQGRSLFFLGSFALALSLLPSVSALGMNRVVLWGIPSCLIVYGLVNCDQVRSRFMIYLGDASYSIYLVQILAIPAFYKLSTKIFDGWNGDFLGFSCLIISVYFGCLTYSLVECPSTARIKTMFNY